MIAAHGSRTEAAVKRYLAEKAKLAPPPVDVVRFDKLERDRLLQEAALRESRRRHEVRMMHEQRVIAEQRRQAEELLARANRLLVQASDTEFVPHVTVQSIIRRACRVFKISREELTAQGRTKRLVLARQFVMYWAARRTKVSATEIARRLGRADHTSALHGKDAYPAKRAAMGRVLRPAR